MRSQVSEIEIVAASEMNCVSVALFLKNQRLPIDDIDPGLQGFFVARDENKIVGTVGIEDYGPVGLLRSLAVNESYRGAKLGKRLFDVALNHAESHGIQTLYLLTTTADSYFGKLGFRRIKREEAPEAIRRTDQFNRLCPASAAIMRKQI